MRMGMGHIYVPCIQQSRKIGENKNILTFNNDNVSRYLTTVCMDLREMYTGIN